MLDKVIAYINEKQMIQKGDRIIIGVSGGADSVCLLLLLLELQETYALKLRVVHIEHGIRGEQSKADATFVEQLCQKKSVEFRMYSYQVQQYAKEHHMTVEEAGRKLRYDTFEKEAKVCEVPVKIAVAHNANDNAETMLFHLTRGSGLDGLCGIPAMRGNIIRPLLCVQRSEIEAYLQQKQQEYRTDATNADVKYHRNKIRHRVLPVLEEMNPQAIRHITSATESLQEVADYLNEQCEEVLRQVRRENTICRKELLAYPQMIQKKVIHRWIAEYASHGKDITALHIRAVVNLLPASIGKSVDLPYGLTVEVTNHTLQISYKEGYGNTQETENKRSLLEVVRDRNIPYVIEMNEKEILQCSDWLIGKYRISWNIKTWDSSCVIPQKSYTKYFDYDKIKSNLEFRYRKQGDYFTVNSCGGTKKFKDYCINEKIPKDVRDDILLLCEDSHILWAVGYRISEKYKVDETTKKVLTVQIMEEEENE